MKPVKPFYDRPVLLWQIRCLNLTGAAIKKAGFAMMNRAHRLTTEAVQEYKEYKASKGE